MREKIKGAGRNGKNEGRWMKELKERIRELEGVFAPIAAYVRDHSEAEFTHGICPECEKRLYPEFSREELAKEEK